ncbi:anti-sigma-factor antagonist [Catenulispora acidiphila DSM 44928]|uniref:Anti-sigma factor antagonist n=1 Tax=Catenulispora acidiphila (strain DSM 44928 / JCM 14897 / NBRC 102108 / NRRL B-24433 / ID139908) TaxID=479433 RepID=C7Q7Y4_CATAD|nr:STAS domain-containing protein [Catenulispora acidiphila]ACU74151.1 anti-sigma-factor antagonist [Catenulispora acidiphila DSM 44928]
MEFSCTARRAAGRVVLTVAGDVDLAAYARFEAGLEQSWDGTTDLVIDCSAVTFLDSMGLRVLVRSRRRAADHGREVMLASPSRPVRRALELAGVTSLFPVAEPVSGAEHGPNPAS